MQSFEQSLNKKLGEIRSVYRNCGLHARSHLTKRAGPFVSITGKFCSNSNFTGNQIPLAWAIFQQESALFRGSQFSQRTDFDCRKICAHTARLEMGCSW